MPFRNLPRRRTSYNIHRCFYESQLHSLVLWRLAKRYKSVLCRLAIVTSAGLHCYVHTVSANQPSPMKKSIRQGIVHFLVPSEIEGSLPSPLSTRWRVIRVGDPSCLWGIKVRVEGGSPVDSKGD